MERLRRERPKGMTRAGLRKWGMLFVILGIFGRGILQTRYLNMANLSTDQLLTLLTDMPDAMFVATLSLIMLLVESMAMPIFCLLLADGFMHTSHGGKYLLRVLGIALLSEIPYNFAMGAKFIDMSSRNPAFGIAVSLILLYLYDYTKEKKPVNLLLKLFVTLAAFVWCAILKIEGGVSILVITLAFWCFRKKPAIRNLAAAAASMFGCIFNIFYLTAPMGIMVAHMYNGQKGEEKRLVSYLFYPVALILCGIIGYYTFGF
ncbi:MAG: hypothetical protein IKB09_09890 [Oscillospiraceae bacterium]|nr:hypothetical protein [Oscillospiraceae bacterium]MBR6595133.1 hypothetical protein [Oscillospiraceae bacterium]